MEVALAILGLCGVIIAAILKMPRSPNGYMRKDMCAEMHKNLSSRITNVERRIDVLEREGRNH